MKCLVCGGEIPPEYNYSICEVCQVPTEPCIKGKHEKILSTPPIASISRLSDEDKNISWGRKFDFAATVVANLADVFCRIGNEKFAIKEELATVGIKKQPGQWPSPLPQPYSDWLEKNYPNEWVWFDKLEKELGDDTFRTFRNLCDGINNDSDAESDECCDVCNLRRGSMAKAEWNSHLESC